VNGALAVSSGNGSAIRSAGSSTAPATSEPVQSALSSVGGDSLAGSGFESERPASGFAPVSAPVGPPSASLARVGASGTDASSESPGSNPDASSGSSVTSEVQSAWSVPSGSSPSSREKFASRAQRTHRTLFGAADRLKGVRRQWGGLPSDAAPHTQPPRMPIDHNE
jgi:hypothetical protein